MESFFAHDDAYTILILAVIGVCISGTFIAWFWFKHLRTAMELELKRDLAERGMSAAEIRAVIEAGPSGKPEREDRDRRRMV